MKCPDGLTWIPDREFCSRCKPGYIWNANWSECTPMDRSVINPPGMPTASAALFGWDCNLGETYSSKKYWPILAIIALFYFWAH